jgi:hypothetical protein
MDVKEREIALEGNLPLLNIHFSVLDRFNFKTD